MHELLGAPNTAYLTGWLVVDHYDGIGYTSQHLSSYLFGS
jgi:hypothetical protein